MRREIDERIRCVFNSGIKQLGPIMMVGSSKFGERAASTRHRNGQSIRREIVYPVPTRHPKRRSRLAPVKVKVCGGLSSNHNELTAAGKSSGRHGKADEP